MLCVLVLETTLFAVISAMGDEQPCRHYGFTCDATPQCCPSASTSVAVSVAQRPICLRGFCECPFGYAWSSSRGSCMSVDAVGNGVGIGGLTYLLWFCGVLIFKAMCVCICLRNRRRLAEQEEGVEEGRTKRDLPPPYEVAVREPPPPYDIAVHS
ncbi:unnamed protein product [Notodromas monacha]|uniref:Uncharacterized protein n=1 Tax=Notodromas monacha TaxID=399045 RepID=A0A7R9BUM2_9CRUS|nr:unnamed protein product [Notodromas monacha]CAG0921025.1 unnamed protein product [Notodromas monacha]